MGIKQYLQDTKAELNHVRWPSKQVTTSYTFLVITISIFVAVFLSVCDYVFHLGFTKFILGVK